MIFMNQNPLVDFGIFHTFTAKVLANGLHFRPGNPDKPNYELVTLPDQRRVFLDPLLPDCCREPLVMVVASFPIPEKFLLDSEVV